MMKIVAFMLLLSVALFAKAQKNQGGSYAENYNEESRREGTESNNNQINVRNNQSENEKVNGNTNENRNTNENWNENEKWNVNKNGYGTGNWNLNENGKKKCDGSKPAENTLERLIDEGTGQEYEIIGYLYPPNPLAQPYYYEVPLVYKK